MKHELDRVERTGAHVAPVSQGTGVSREMPVPAGVGTLVHGLDLEDTRMIVKPKVKMVFEEEYGDSEVQSFERHDDYNGQPWWWRNESYHSKLDGQVYYQKIHCLSDSDFSRSHSCQVGKGYDSKCSCCWLNIPHTDGVHKHNIA